MGESVNAASATAVIVFLSIWILLKIWLCANWRSCQRNQVWLRWQLRQLAHSQILRRIQMLRKTITAVALAALTLSPILAQSQQIGPATTVKLAQTTSPT